MASPAPFERPARERALAWIYTGPVGLTLATAADVVELWGRWGAASALTRLRRAGRARSPGSRSSAR